MAVPGFSSLSLGEDDSVHKSGTTALDFVRAMARSVSQMAQSRRTVE